ncbi:MAG: PhoH family protein [Candidatus Krumholzibacteriota bacterium]|nr:PhoH family protein [Candidatus Krumholzibacteriota bacterium]
MKRKTDKKTLSFAGIDPVRLLGVKDRNLRLVEDHFGTDITVRGDEIILIGSARKIAELSAVWGTLITIAGNGRAVTEGDVVAVMRGESDQPERISALDKTVVYYSSYRRKSVVPRSLKQKEYVDAIADNDVIFAIGPAGTGKTFLAIAMALAALKKGEIDKIFVSRPVVEAGENLGFLPGDIQEKIDPYIRPIFDALSYLVGKERVQRMIDSGVLEIAPLAYMRGRTLDNSFAVLDEAQNSTVMQMKMFLTRLGVNAKAIVTGDITQIDLADPGKSGLLTVNEILQGVEGIKFIHFGEEDVVRHRLVRRIIRAFSNLSYRNSRPSSAPPGEANENNNDAAVPAGTEIKDE